MAGQFVYNSAGQRVWIDDGTDVSSSLGPAPFSGPGGGGFQMGGPGGQFGNLAALPNYGTNKEATRLLWNESQTPYTIDAAQASPVKMDRAAEMATRAKQLEYLAALEGQAAGGGPSAASSMALAGKDAAIRAQMAAGGLRAGLAGGSAMQGQNALSGAAAKAQEQQGAWSGMTNAAYGVRGADIAGATEQAKLAQQIGLANAGFKTQANIANQNAYLAGLGNKGAAAQMYGDLVQDAYGADLGYRGYLREGSRMDRARKDRANEAAQAEAAQYVKTGASMMAMASDERVKTDVDPGEAKLREMLDALEAYEYRYKDTSREGTSPGKHISVMAQDLEKSELGDKAVFDSEEGHKMVDYGKLAPSMLAGLAMLNKRINKLEKR